MRRAQAAMEFLMTYGWAILVVLVVIGALAYFGVLSPSSVLPEKCTLPLQLSCRDYRVTDTSVKFFIQNGAGKDLNVTRIAMQGDAISGVCANDSVLSPGGVGFGAFSAGGTETTISNGGSTEFSIKCTFQPTGRDKNRYTINITYKWLDSSYSHVIQGELFAKKES